MPETSSNPLSPELRGDITRGLDAIGRKADHNRTRLGAPYQQHDPQAWLGSPVDLGIRDEPDRLAWYQERTAAAGGATRYLDEVADRVAESDHLMLDYKSGRLALHTVGAWRRDVEGVYGNLAVALDAAHSSLETATTADSEAPPPAPLARARRTPQPELLDGRDSVDVRTLAAALGVTEEQARRRVRAGEFGKVSKQGGRNWVLADAVRKALGLGPSAAA